MKPAPFAYHCPSTLDEALDLLSSLENAKLLAGGQSLVPMLNMRFAVPDHVIDLNRIEGLRGIEIQDGWMEIGAMTRQRELERSAEVKRLLPIVIEALPHVGHFQTRNRGTIGGSLCHLDPSAELPALCLLLDAELIAAGPKGQRSIAARDWFQGFMQSALQPNEILTAIRIKIDASRGYGFSEFSRRQGDYAIAGAAVLNAVDGRGRIQRCGIAVFGASVRPQRLYAAEQALIGKEPHAEAFREAAAHAGGLDATGDATASASYRLKIAAAMVRRALALSLHKAKDQTA